MKKLLQRRKNHRSVDNVTVPVVEQLLQDIHALKCEQLSSSCCTFPEFFVAGADAVSSAETLALLFGVSTPGGPSTVVRFVVALAASVEASLLTHHGAVLHIGPSTHCEEQTQRSATTPLDLVCDVVQLPRVASSSATIMEDIQNTVASREAQFAHDLSSSNERLRQGSESPRGDHSIHTTLKVPIYLLCYPLEDNGSQRMCTAMPFLTLFFRWSQSIDVVSHNNKRLRDVLLACQGDSTLIGSRDALSPEATQLTSTTTRLRVGNAVLVHCMMGVSRSVAVVIWYILEEWGRATNGQFDRVSFNSVLELIRKARASASPNLCFAAEIAAMVRRLSK